MMKSILIKDTTREERERIVYQALWGACGIDCEFCSGCDNRGGGRMPWSCPIRMQTNSMERIPVCHRPNCKQHEQEASP